MQKETNEDEEDKLWSEEKDVLVIKSKKPKISNTYFMSTRLEVENTPYFSFPQCRRLAAFLLCRLLVPIKNVGRD